MESFNTMESKMADEHAFNIAFVSEVEKHPQLYNYNLPEYSRKDVVEKAWSEVGQQMKMTGMYENIFNFKII